MGSDALAEDRRARSLGLAPAVRWYNDAAVPGLGGVWFAKQLVLALLGIELAARDGLRPVVVSNAVEALACWFAIHKLRRVRDPRVRGSQKLSSKPCPSFSEAKRPTYYVTQPMRQQTVQPLRALGLVETASSDRFNTYQLSEAGRRILEAAFGSVRPFNSTVEAVLGQWISGRRDSIEKSEPLAHALSPTQVLPVRARSLLREQLVAVGEGRARRASALAWVSAQPTSTDPSWRARPRQVDDDHWEDLRAGAHFFSLRDAALRVLQAVEIWLTNEMTGSVPLSSRWPALDAQISSLRAAAHAFQTECHDTSPGRLSSTFAEECARAETPELLRLLVRRDERVLRLKGDDIVQGSAFKPVKEYYGAPRPGDAGDDDEHDRSDRQRWPVGISRRIPNLHTLSVDLDGRLDAHLRADGVHS